MRYKLLLSYNGANFSGWQVQKNSITIQEELDKALSILFSSEVKTCGAGRTDSGVNAINYICHFDASKATFFDEQKLIYKLNAILPKSIVVHKIEEVDEEFHARFSAKQREYHYFLHRSKDPFVEHFSYRYTFDLDIERMNAACQYLLGTKDFSCFEKSGGGNTTSICTVFYAKWSYYKPSHLELMNYPGGKEDYLVFTIRANRFLRNMVRAIVGTLLEIGRNKHEINWIESLLEGKNRTAAGESVPGNALFLNDIEY